MKKVIAVLTMTLLCVVALCACTPKLDDLKKTYEDEKYLTVPFQASSIGLEDDKVEYVFAATKVTESVFIVCFKDGGDASDFYKKCQDGDVNGAKACKKKGNAVIFGTEGALKLV